MPERSGDGQRGPDAGRELDRTAAADADASADLERTAEFDDDATLPSSDDGAEASSTARPAASGARFVPGDTLADRYRIVTALGKGGMGEVYRADDLTLGQPVALKFLPPEFEADSERRALLFEEIKVARKIGHPNVCRVYDLGEAGGVYFLSMEYIDGEDLKSLLQRIGRPSWSKSVELGRQICEGLGSVHAQGVLHRDLKPANLMIDGKGQARITDFGLAAIAESLAGGDICGTPPYMAPEQFYGEAATVASDLYALGLVLYELFTGRQAFSPGSFDEARRLHQQAIPTPPSELQFGFDPAVEEIILRCLAKEPAARPGSAAEVAAALEEGAGTGVAEGAQVATLLASDLVTGAQRVESLGDSTGDDLFQLHDRMVRDLAELHGGREISKSDDGFLFLFRRPLEALSHALDYHRKLGELSRERNVELGAGVAIHLGEVVVRRNPPQDVERGASPLEIEGFARPMVGRLRSLATARQTLLNGGAFDVARRSARGELKEADSLRWLAHGEYAFDDAEEPSAVFEVGLADVAPLEPPQSRAGVRRVAEEDTILGWRPAPGLEVPLRPNWTVQRKLGEGGFGETWLVTHKKSGEHRVYKYCYEKELLFSLQREITVFRLLKEELGLRDDISRILDWNLDEAPYFLEFSYVEGGSIVDWARTRGGLDRVPLEERLGLVAQVAGALSAAHSVGVLHKDVKPANVLVSEAEDGTPRAILTDFGIGMITDQHRLVDKGITVLGMTEIDSGTGSSSSGGTQAYMAPELLTGQAGTIQADIYALGVMLYQMAVGDVDRPMPHGWERHVDDDLLRQDIAECVDGNPERRPGSAAEVARRLLELEERRAAREAERRRLLDAEKAKRRRKVLTIAASVSTVFLVVVSLLAIQAIRARADAERRRAQAERLIDFMLTDLHEGLDRIGRLDLLEGVARSSQEHFESLSERDETPEALYKRGLTLQNIGDVLLDQGDAQAARSSQESAIALFEAAVETDSANDEWRQGLVQSRLRLGNALREQGDTDAALASFRSALDLARELADARPDDDDRLFAVAQCHYRIAFLQRRIGDDEAALQEAGEALALLEPLTAAEGADWRRHLLLLETHALLSVVHRFRGTYELALESATRVREIAERLEIEDPGNTYWPRKLAWSHSEIGMLSSLLGTPESALASAQAARAAYRTLTITDPTRVEWRNRLAYTTQMTGYILVGLDQPDRALELYAEAKTVIEGLLEEDPSRVQWLRQLADNYMITGQVHRDEGRPSASATSFESSIELMKRVVAATGEDPAPRNLLSFHRLFLGDAYAELGQPDRAREQWNRAVEEIEPITAASDNVQYLDTHAQALLRLGRLEESRPLVEKLLAAGWDDPGFRDLVRKSGLEVELP